MMDDQRLETRVMNGNRLDEFIHIVVALGGGLDNTEALELLKAFVHLRAELSSYPKRDIGLVPDVDRWLDTDMPEGMMMRSK